MKTRVKEGAESGELEGLATTRKSRVVRFQKLGTDPTIVNKIKGLSGFGGGAGAEDGWRGLKKFLKIST